MRGFLDAEHNRIGPAPGTDSLARLQHVLKVFEASDGAEEVITATRNVYATEPWTGLTLGDLRSLAAAFIPSAVSREDDSAERPAPEGQLAPGTTSHHAEEATDVR